MKLDLTVQELEFIFDNLPSVSEFEVRKEIEGITYILQNEAGKVLDFSPLNVSQ